MTRDETSFFRDFEAFETVRRWVLPRRFLERGSRQPLRIWSAGCSSGQEPYSLAMILREHFPGRIGRNAWILASDQSPSMIERAALGRYSQAEVNRGLPVALLVKYFRREGLEWVVEDSIRQAVEFRPIDLAGDWPTLADLDLVVLRNVLNLLEPEARGDVLNRVAGSMAPGGYLWLGEDEATLGPEPLLESFEPIDLARPSIHRLRRR